MPEQGKPPSELPVLSIACNTGSFPPVIINLYPDWEKSGECHISYIDLPDLIETCRLLTFIIDAAADEVWAVQHERAKRIMREEDDLPF